MSTSSAGKEKGKGKGKGKFSVAHHEAEGKKTGKGEILSLIQGRKGKFSVAIHATEIRKEGRGAKGREGEVLTRPAERRRRNL